MRNLKSYYDPIRIGFRNKSTLWNGSDSEERFDAHGNKEYTKDDISYIMNSEGFRCDDFKELTAIPNITFIGCSITEGVGVPENSTWTKLLHNKILQHLKLNNKQFSLPYYNLGMGAAGLDQISRMIVQYWPILQPKITFAHFPDLFRREVVTQSDFSHWLPAQNNEIGNPKFFIDDNYAIYQTEKNLLIMQEYFEKYNTICLYTEWSKTIDPHVTIQNIIEDNAPRFSRFIKLDTIFLKKDNARDNMHPGKQSMEHYANSVFNCSKPNLNSLFKI